MSFVTTAGTRTPGSAGEDAGQEFAFLTSLPDGPERRQVLARLVDAWQPTARRLARRYAGPAVGREELRQAADAGLVEALGRYVPERDGAFEAFADEVIRAELQRGHEEDDPVNDVLRQVGKVRDVVRGTLQKLEGRTGPGDAVVARIAARAGLDEDDVVLGLEVLDSQVSLGLDTALTTEGDARGTPEDEDGGSLSEHELRVLHMRYFRHLSPEQIAAELALPTADITRTLTHASHAIRTLTASGHSGD
ncbi:sigma factor [Streptomyces sp. HNM0574]|uniref:sigma-70 family RNA polymerase sigma factor n=1 Tax=Streptomyces sp. HNM0574 TaxID=2714954 RepID=UPI00146F516E|nr:sigma factor [Streptomyces sp. HNM0574]NLU70745.1 hypothetical protein [Streptomyces sp. HNM0574]